MTSSCELFVIGEQGQDDAIERSQQSSAGVVHLWKAELDSNNMMAVTELMRNANGTSLLAMQRYELAEDLEHWKNLIGDKPITATVIDTVASDKHVVQATVDYIRKVTFSTVRENSLWYVTTVR